MTRVFEKEVRNNVNSKWLFSKLQHKQAFCIYGKAKEESLQQKLDLEEVSRYMITIEAIEIHEWISGGELKTRVIKYDVILINLKGI